jgi:hypothetical protein
MWREEALHTWMWRRMRSRCRGGVISCFGSVSQAPRRRSGDRLLPKLLRGWVGLFTVWGVFVLGQVRTLLSSPRYCLRRLYVLRMYDAIVH